MRQQNGWPRAVHKAHCDLGAPIIYKGLGGSCRLRQPALKCFDAGASWQKQGPSMLLKLLRTAFCQAMHRKPLSSRPDPCPQCLHGREAPTQTPAGFRGHARCRCALRRPRRAWQPSHAKHRLQRPLERDDFMDDLIDEAALSSMSF